MPWCGRFLATGGAGDGRHAVCQARRLVPGAASGSARAGCAQRLRRRAAPLAGAPAPVLGAAALVVGVWRSGQRFEWQECEVRALPTTQAIAIGYSILEPSPRP